jgi:hypothetical protein
MAVILKINDLVVCWKIHGCGWVDDPVPRKSRLVHIFYPVWFSESHHLSMEIG